jgi:hypothetical protein
MIQRIQSVYLLLVIIAYTLLFFFPIATYTTIDTVFSFSILEISGANSNSSFPLMGAVIVLGLAVLVTIFLYKKRLLQIKITAIILLAHIAFVAALFYVADVLSKKFGADAVYESGAYIALIPLVFLVLANRAIRKDEKMVRSTDRLRD